MGYKSQAIYRNTFQLLGILLSGFNFLSILNNMNQSDIFAGSKGSMQSSTFHVDLCNLEKLDNRKGMEKGAG